MNSTAVLPRLSLSALLASFLLTSLSGCDMLLQDENRTETTAPIEEYVPPVVANPGQGGSIDGIWVSEDSDEFPVVYQFTGGRFSVDVFDCVVVGSYTANGTEGTIQLDRSQTTCDVEDEVSFDEVIRYRIITRGGIERIELFEDGEWEDLGVVRQSSTPTPEPNPNPTPTPTPLPEITDFGTLDTWFEGTLNGGDTVAFAYSVTPGTTYFLVLDDADRNGDADCRITLSRPNGTSYEDFDSRDVVYSPAAIEALDTQIIVTVRGYNSNVTGSFSVWLGTETP